MAKNILGDFDLVRELVIMHIFSRKYHYFMSSQFKLYSVNILCISITSTYCIFIESLNAMPPGLLKCIDTLADRLVSKAPQLK